MRYMTGDYATEYDQTTEVLFATLEEAGVEYYQVEFVRDILLPELIGGRLRQYTDLADYAANFVPFLDLLFIGLLVREFMPQEGGSIGYRDEEDPTHAAFRGAVMTAKDHGAEEAAIQHDATEVFAMFKVVASSTLGGELPGDVLILMTIGMILHRRILVEEVE